eukprot:g25224.t1
MINGLVKPSRGRVVVNGFDTVAQEDQARMQSGFVFQNPQNQIILPILREDIALGLGPRKLSRLAADAAVAAILDRFAIRHLADRRVHELSGGELQLAALASVLVTEPPILVMDEPTNQLDLKNRNLVERTIQALPEDVIVISHDLQLLTGFDRVLLFHDGVIAADGRPEGATALWRRLRPFALVIVVVSIFNAVLVSPVDGLVTLFRLLALSALASLVTATTTTGDFIAVITRAAAPLERIGVMRAADLGLSIGLVIRFVPEILSRYEAIREAHRARGIRPRPSSLLVPLIIGTLRSADEIAAAIDARDIRRHK